MDQLLDQLKEVAPSVEIRVREDLEYDEQDMIAALEAAHFAIFDHPSVIDASSSFDHNSRSVQVEASLGLGIRSVVSAVDLESLANNSLARSSEAAARFRVEVTLAEDGLRSSSNEADHTDWHIGGEELRNPAGVLQCTAGFNVRTNSATTGDRGLATAAHCIGASRDDGEVLPWGDQHNGDLGDFEYRFGTQWNAGGFRNDNFYSGNANNHRVNSKHA